MIWTDEMSHFLGPAALRTVLSVTAVLSALTPGAVYADDATVRATTYLRAGPGTAFRSVDEAAGGATVQVLGCADGWCRIQLGDAAGYVASAALTPGPAPTMPPGARQTCFLDPLSGYHGSRDEEFCSPAAPR